MSRKSKLPSAGPALIITHLLAMSVRGGESIVRDLAPVTDGRGWFMLSG